MIINTKNGIVKIFAKTIEEEAIEQITNLANSELGENANIRIMPDVHAGKGCTIGTTMLITDKVCPNLVGVDIGCGVLLAQTDLNFRKLLPKLDHIIKTKVPNGFNVHDKPNYDVPYLNCHRSFTEKNLNTFSRSLGTLGGGNHFIEAYEDGYIAIHTGSRNLGNVVAQLYQKIAEEKCPQMPKGLGYLTDEDMDNYLADMDTVQAFAKLNRAKILDTVIAELGGRIISTVDTIHNYIELGAEDTILRKGSISAKLGEIISIPLNMRDGLLICQGKGNIDWNCSAPHGAGRLYSRKKAKANFKIEDYQMSMQGIYSSCISQSTIDEAPFAYKDCQEIMKLIQSTATIIRHLTPIYNFKAN